MIRPWIVQVCGKSYEFDVVIVHSWMWYTEDLVPVTGENKVQCFCNSGENRGNDPRTKLTTSDLVVLLWLGTNSQRLPAWRRMNSIVNSIVDSSTSDCWCTTYKWEMCWLSHQHQLLPIPIPIRNDWYHTTSGRGGRSRDVINNYELSVKYMDTFIKNAHIKKAANFQFHAGGSCGTCCPSFVPRSWWVTIKPSTRRHHPWCVEDACLLGWGVDKPQTMIRRQKMVCPKSILLHIMLHALVPPRGER